MIAKTLAKLNPELRGLLRDIEHLAYWSKCDARVLYNAAVACTKAIRTLGLTCNDPHSNRNEQYYKDWIVDAVKAASSNVNDWEVLDGTMTIVLPEFRKIEANLSTCSPKLSEIDAPVVRSAAEEG